MLTPLVCCVLGNTGEGFQAAGDLVVVTFNGGHLHLACGCLAGALLDLGLDVCGQLLSLGILLFWVQFLQNNLHGAQEIMVHGLK